MDPANPFQTRSIETAKLTQNSPTAVCNISQKYYIVTVNSSMTATKRRASSPFSGLTTTLSTVWQLLTLNRCLPNTVERICHHWYAVLMHFWNESHCIAAFWRHVLCIINAIHKLYNYTSICHCPIYLIICKSILGWFHLIALQMVFWERISLRLLCSTNRQSTGKNIGPFL